LCCLAENLYREDANKEQEIHCSPAAIAGSTHGVDLRNLRARVARLRDLRLLFETRTMQNLDRRSHRGIVQKPTLISLISQSDPVIMPTAGAPPGTAACHGRSRRKVFGASEASWDGEARANHLPLRREHAENYPVDEDERRGEWDERV
jgi:hypothetical protein